METVAERDIYVLDSLKELAQLCAQRARTYRFIARLFESEMTQAEIDEMAHMRFPVSTGYHKVDEGYKAIAEYLARRWENSLEELEVDFTRAFIGHGIDAFSAAYPFESVYTSEKRLLMQAARDEVRAIYLSMQVDKSESWKEGEDHVALELAFMAILCERTQKALERGDEEEAVSLLAFQQGFLEEHLASWAPMMTADMRRFVKTDFYRGASMLLEGFLESETDLLKELLDEESDYIEVVGAE